MSVAARRPSPKSRRNARVCRLTRRNCHHFSTIRAQLTIEKPSRMSRTVLPTGPAFRTSSSTPLETSLGDKATPFRFSDSTRIARHSLTFPPPDSYNRLVARFGPLAFVLVLWLAAVAAGADVRETVTTFLGRVGNARVTDLTIQQMRTIYHPDGRRPSSAGDQVLYIKLPKRQRLEQTVEGQREVRLTVGERTWIRRADGRVDEAPAEPRRDAARLLTPLARSADDVIAEWHALGVRPNVSQVIQIRGRPVTIIGARPDDRTTPAVWFDADYGVVRFVTNERFPEGATLLDVTLSDHRPLVDGFYFPYRQELFANGRLLLRTVVRTASVNSNLPDALFDPRRIRDDR